MQGWKKEFGEEYDIPKEITDRYDDASWHNDAMPSFLMFQENPPETDTDEIGSTIVLPSEEPYYNMHVWVEHPDKTERSELCGFKRFTIVIGGDCDGICLGESEELDDEFLTRLRIAEKYAKTHGLAHIVKQGGLDDAKPLCSCGNRSMASMGTDVICDACHKYCGEIV